MNIPGFFISIIKQIIWRCKEAVTCYNVSQMIIRAAGRTPGKGESVMRIRIDRVRKDDNGKELSRSTVGEYGSDIEALAALKKQEEVLRTVGNDNTCVEMINLH